MDHSIPHGQGRHLPLVIVSAVGVVDHALVVGLDDPEILKGRAAGHDMGFVALGQFHGHAQRDQIKIPLLHDHILGRPQVDPVGLAVDGPELFNFVAEIADPDGL